MILIVGQRPDPHIEAVVEILRQRGAPVCVLDRHASHDAVSFELSNEHGQARIHTDDAECDLADVSCVWWRVKPAVPVEFPGGSGTVTDHFRSREWSALLRSLPAWLPHAVWVNPLVGYQVPRTKPAQLMLARTIGLTIPDTVISNDVDGLVPFFNRHPRVIYKTLDSFLIPPDQIIYTNVATLDDVRRRREEVRMAPCMFQELVEKRSELRVTVVGERVFAVAIDSQSDPGTAIDWRRDQTRGMYSVTTLSDHLSATLRTFMKQASLLYGAFDLIVTPDEQMVFLECNPGGQWLWLEKATHLPISRAVADLLANSAVHEAALD